MESAEDHLEEFEKKWNLKYPMISKSWKTNWNRLTTFFNYAPEIRKVICTTSAIESSNMTLKKTLKTRASFPNDEAVLKLIYLALKNIQRKWTFLVIFGLPAFTSACLFISDYLDTSLISYEY